MSLKLLVIFLLIGISFTAYAQPGLHYTQYMDNPTPINPAYSLTNNYGSVSFTGRKQWVGVSGSPALILFNVDFPSIIDNSKAGVIASDNSLGVEHISRLDAFFAKSIQISETERLGVSINAGLRYYSTAYAPLDPLDPAIQNDVKQISPNVGIGVIYYSDSYYIGLSLPQFTIHSTDALMDNNNFRNQYALMAGLSSDLDNGFKLKPATLINFSRGVPVTVDLSTKLTIKDTFAVGVNFRSTYEAAALFSLEGDSFHMGYSYQFGTLANSVGTFGNSTHELTLTFLFGRGNQVPINPGAR